MAQSRPVQGVSLLLGALVVSALGGAATLGSADLARETDRVRTVVASSTPSPVPAPPAPGSLAAYALAANRVCVGAFGAATPVNVLRQSLAYVLANRARSAALEVRTAEQLLALERPRDRRTARVPAVLVAYREAYAAVTAAARADGRSLRARSAAVADAQSGTRTASAAAGRVFRAFGAERCVAWLNPAALQDSGAD